MFTIGEFSKLSYVSARMLRHYDAMGLLRPACIGENGYRYYASEQLAVLLQIEKLKRYGFALGEIGGLLALEAGELAHRIHVRRLQAYRELNELRDTLRRMEADLLTMEGNTMVLEKYTPQIMETVPQKVFGLRRNINMGEFATIINDMLAELKARGFTCKGPVQMLYHDNELTFENMDVEVVTEVNEDHDGAKVLPGGTFVAVLHKGPYEEIHYAYEALAAWMTQHPEYKINGPSMERYLNSPCAVAQQELETEVMFQLAKNMGAMLP